MYYSLIVYNILFYSTYLHHSSITTHTAGHLLTDVRWRPGKYIQRISSVYLVFTVQIWNYNIMNYKQYAYNK